MILTKNKNFVRVSPKILKFENFWNFHEMCQSLACQSLARDCMYYIQSDSNTIRDILKNFSLGSLIKVSTDSNDLSLACDKSLMTFRMASLKLT